MMILSKKLVVEHSYKSKVYQNDNYGEIQEIE